MKRGKYRPGIFAVVYSTSNKKVEYALLKRKKHWVGWEFTKGKVEFLETKRHAVRREVKEETGLDILSVKKLRENGKYLYGQKLPDRKEYVGQSYSLYGVRVKKDKMKIDSKEHSGYGWFSFDEALRKLTWPNQRKSLRVVNSWLTR